MAHPKRRFRVHGTGTVLLLTLMMLVLLTFEVAVISLVAQRGLGEEGMLHSQHIAVRRANEVVLNRLEESLSNYLRSNPGSSAETAFAMGGSNDIDESDLMISNPNTAASENTNIKISAWVAERRGIWYHLVGRARGNGVDLLLHRWVKINPCQIAGTLTTILTNVRRPGQQTYEPGILVSADGRAYWGQDATSAQNGGGTYWTWHKDTGLSTIITGQDQPGHDVNDVTMHVLTSTGRVVFSGDEYRVWSWEPSTGLSTVVTGNSGGGFTISPDDRVYFGCQWGSGFWGWKASDGLSTIQTPPGGNGQCPVGKPTNNRVLFVDQNNSSVDEGLYLWSWSTGMSTLIPEGHTDPVIPTAFINANSSGDTSNTNAAGTDGWLGENWNDTSGSVFRWNESSGISLIINEGCYACNGWRYFANGTVLFGGWNALYTWSTGNGLSTIPNLSANNGGDWSVTDERGVFPEYQSVYWWQYNGGANNVTNIVNGSGYGNGVGRDKSAFDRRTNRVFFGSDHGSNNSRFYTWHPSTGLSTIVGNTSGKNYAGQYSTVVDAVNVDMVYFGDDGAAGSLNVWSKQYGLSTIVSGRPYPAVGAIAKHPQGGVFFGEYADSGNFYFWEPPGSCDDRGF